MSSKHRRHIAKEIVERTLNHLKNQREEAARIQSLSREVERKSPQAPQISVEPEQKKENTHKPFQPSVFKRLSQSIIQSSNGKSDLSQKVEPEQKKESTNGPAQLSVFERLSQTFQKNTETEPKLENANRSTKPSIFERLSRQATEEKETE